MKIVAIAVHEHHDSTQTTQTVLQTIVIFQSRPKVDHIPNRGAIVFVVVANNRAFRELRFTK